VCTPSPPPSPIEFQEVKRLRGDLQLRRARLYEAFAKPPQQVRIVRGDSHRTETLARVKEALKGRPVDLLFIDADHSYEGVARDFGMYTPLVRRGGLVGLHDIIPDYRHRYGTPTGAESGEVYRFWQEVKERHAANHEILEIVENPDQDGFGIGALRM